MENDMSELKAQVKAATLHGVGERMEVLREAARIEVAQWQGAKQALHELARKLEAHLGVVDRDAEEGHLDDAQRSLVKRYVNQCGGIARNLTSAAEVQLVQAQGKVLALDRALLDVRQAYERVQAKADSSGGENPTAQERPTGKHPGDPLEERREEARQRKSNRKGNSHAKSRKQEKPRAADA